MVRGNADGVSLGRVAESVPGKRAGDASGDFDHGVPLQGESPRAAALLVNANAEDGIDKHLVDHRASEQSTAYPGGLGLRPPFQVSGFGVSGGQ